jgi:hypothetical protein
MLPTVTLLIGAFWGGGAGWAAGSRLMVRVNVVPREPLAGETLRMPPPPPALLPATGS